MQRDENESVSDNIPPPNRLRRLHRAAGRRRPRISRDQIDLKAWKAFAIDLASYCDEALKISFLSNDFTDNSSTARLVVAAGQFSNLSGDSSGLAMAAFLVGGGEYVPAIWMACGLFIAGLLPLSLIYRTATTGSQDA